MPDDGRQLYFSPPSGRERPPRERASGTVRVLGCGLMACAAVMVLLVLIAGAVIAVSVETDSAHSTLTRTFAVSGTPTLVLRGDVGDVTIVRGTSGHVVATVDREIRSFTHARSEQALAQTQPELQQTGNTISLTTHTGNLLFALRERTTVRVEVPETTTVDARVTVGNLTIDDISGTITAEATTGNVRLDGVILSGHSAAHATTGNVTLNGSLASGAVVEATVTTGNVTARVPAGTSAHVDAHVTTGNVSVVGKSWNLPVVRGITDSTVTGDLTPNPSATLTLSATTGNVTLAQQ